MRFGRNGRQVAYRGQRLYTFVADRGTSVRGNHVQGFLVAKVHSGGCPLQVVQVVSGRGFGKMLANTAGLSLYYMPSGSCTGVCLGTWPPLVMPAGSTAVPTGVACLGTANSGGQRQVTYRRHLLFTFTGDSGPSVNGNNLAGFVVAKVTTGAC